MAVHQERDGDFGVHRQAVQWVPPARRTFWDIAAIALALTVMGGALAAGDGAGEWLSRARLAAPPWLVRALAAPIVLRAQPQTPAPTTAPLVDFDADLEPTALQAVHLVDAPLMGLRTIHGAPDPWIDLALQAELERLAPPRGAARLSVSVRHLPTGASASLNGEAAHTPASLYKVGVLGEVLAQRAVGNLSLTDRLWLTWDDWYDGAGVLQGRIGEGFSVEELLRLMIGYSDNVAASALMRRVGLDSVNYFYAAHGLTRTRLYADDRPDVVTADDMASLLTQLVTQALTDDESTLYMLQYLAQTQPAAWIRESLPPDVTVAHKSGQLLGVRNDAAIVYGPSGPYVLVVLTEDMADDTYGEALIRLVTDAVDDYLSRSYPAAIFDVR